MKFLKSLLFILIACFSVWGSCAFTEMLNPKDWTVFVKTYGTDKFSVNFPVDPKISAYDVSEQKVLSIKAEEGGAEYTLQIAPKFDEKTIFDSFENLKNNDSITILDQSFTQNETRKILDYSYKDDKQSKLFKTHVIITEKNVYSFSTCYPEGIKDSHQFFISSFYLEP